MKVEQVMTNNIACLNTGDSIHDAAAVMQKHNIGFVPVCDNNKLVGVVTDRDMVTRCIAQGKDPNATAINEIMTQEIHKVSPQDNMSVVEDIMSEHKVRRIPVTEEDRIVGVVSIGDIATHDGIRNKAKRTLSDISEPSQPMNMN